MWLADGCLALLDWRVAGRERLAAADERDVGPRAGYKVNGTAEGPTVNTEPSDDCFAFVFFSLVAACVAIAVVVDVVVVAVCEAVTGVVVMAVACAGAGRGAAADVDVTTVVIVIVCDAGAVGDDCDGTKMGLSTESPDGRCRCTVSGAKYTKNWSQGVTALCAFQP